jgi:SH3-like domain-containing protein
MMPQTLLATARFLDRSLAQVRRKVKPTHLAALALCLGAGLAVFMVQGLRGGEAKSPGDITASTDAAPVQRGPSGFPIPRFLSLKAGKVNVRKGPSSDHAVAWVFQRKGMPVEVIAEFENWRKIRDASGEEGWILQQMLSGRRFALSPDWSRDKGVLLHDSDTATSARVAKLAPGAIAQVESCTGGWCYLTTENYEGYARQTELWGVYPDEVVD